MKTTRTFAVSAIACSMIAVSTYSLQQMSSRNFSSDSGYAKETWEPLANGWVSQSSGALGDGTKTTAVKFFQRLDDDTFSMKSTDRTLGGVRLPDLKEVVFRRSVKKAAA
jgi:hypothetical protein